MLVKKKKEYFKLLLKMKLNPFNNNNLNHKVIKILIENKKRSKELVMEAIKQGKIKNGTLKII